MRLCVLIFLSAFSGITGCGEKAQSPNTAPDNTKLTQPDVNTLAAAAAGKSTVKLPSGLVYLSVKEGNGVKPRDTDIVTVNYAGSFVDGKQFDRSKPGEPASFPLDGVILCLTEGIQQMKTGGKAQFVCPPALAFGAAGSPPTIPGNTTLVFEVELLRVEKQDAAGGAAKSYDEELDELLEPTEEEKEQDRQRAARGREIEERLRQAERASKAADENLRKDCVRLHPTDPRRETLCAKVLN